MVECPECGEKNPGEATFCSSCGKKINSVTKEVPEEVQQSHDGLIILGYILAVIGAFSLFIGTILAIIVGIVLYGKENPKDKKNGKFIIIAAILVPIILVAISAIALVIYNSYFSSPTFSSEQDIQSVRNAANAATYLLFR